MGNFVLLYYNKILIYKIKFYRFSNFRIVLGLVNFRDNMIDYPNSKTYLKNFLVTITEKEIIDLKLHQVYEKCCENIEKCII